MLTKIYYFVLNALWTLWYFTGCGLFYGAMLGIVAGTGFFPLVGTLMGLFLGVMIGGSSGFVIGIGVLIVHSLFFDRDTDLERYRLWLGRGVGIFSILATLLVALLLAATSWHVRFWRPVDWLFPAIVIGTILVWLSLSSAYTASYYPDRIITRLLRQGRLEIDPVMIQLGDHEVMQLSDWLLTRFFTIWVYSGAVVIAGSILILIAAPWLRVPQGLEWVLPAAWCGMVVAGIMALCCSTGNAALLVFLKRLVMPVMSPHWHRVTLTLISFFYTLVTHWWSLIFAPVIAFFIAYNVYHTLALPNYQSDKAKRKEVAVGMMAGQI